MTTLTSSQLTYIRTNTGTGTTAVPDDTYLQYIYDNQADSDLDTTVYYALLAARADASDKVSNANSRTGDSQSSQQWFEHLNKMIADWGARTGAGLATSTTGSINLGIDEEDSEFNIT